MATIDDHAHHLRDTHGGHWGEHPTWPVDDWTTEVTNGDTRLGYWQWVAAHTEEMN